MRGAGRVLAALLVGASGVACGGAPEGQQPVVLWERGVVRPRFPVAPEASWEPVHQRLRRGLEPGVGNGDLLACYGVADLDAAVAFYAEAYGVEAGAIPWQEIPPAVWSAQQAALAAELGRPLQLELPPSARRADLAQRGDLPRLLLETPRLDAATGEVAPAGLVCLHWSQGEKPEVD